ncbi:Retrotransposable element Tf2 [Gossypium australe]|uniref:Retrotransposable element Tf2 n=1 Tax=Gossypium australe TaxID=47621 RepID=A0A5B6VJG1_9ROSI|nr:Retrotransposable element Tf2 [Gossypium australe]
MTDEWPSDRVLWLPMAEWWYNTTYHTVSSAHLMRHSMIFTCGQKFKTSRGSQTIASVLLQKSTG